MKDLSHLSAGISTSSSAAAIYNGLRTISPATYNEAKRTLEAIACVQGHDLLLRKVEEEVADDKRRN